MLFFLASVLEQLDLALEHVAKRDVHNARFGLMLTDNALELVFHRIAKRKAGEINSYRYLQETYPHQKALEKATGRNFDDKVRFAKLEANLSDKVAQTIIIMHGIRNELYHVGIQHEEILPSLAIFYFSTACKFLQRYRISGMSWSSGMVLPERAQKYFTGTRFFPGEEGDFGTACEILAQQCGHNPAETISVLADRMEAIVRDQDKYIGIAAQGVYVGQQTTRDKAVIDCQAWPLAFTDEGKEFLAAKGWSGSVLSGVEFIADHYPLKYKIDPIPSWERRAARLRSQTDPHAALTYYHSFMSETAGLREAIEEAAAQVEAEIDAAVDRMRGK